MERVTPAVTKSIEDISDRIGLGEPPHTPQNNRYKRWTRNVALGFAALAATGVTYRLLDRSGQYEHFLPTINRPVEIDNVERIISWNVAGQAAERADQIRTLATGYGNADAIALQEVDTADAERLHRDFPAWHIIYALADQKQHITQGGYGNVLMTRQSPSDIKTRSLAGKSFINSAVGAVAGLPSDAANFDISFTATKEGWQERRVALAESTEVISGDKLETIKIINTHISGSDSVHKHQLRDAMDFIKDNIQTDQPLVACGDFNAQLPEITSAFAKIGMVTPTKEGLNDDYNGDFCGYYMANETTLPQVYVLGDFKTDHYPLEFTWSLDGSTTQ